MRALRVLAVTAALSVAGAVFGGLAGTVTLVGWGIATSGLRIVLRDPEMGLYGTLFGGVLGAVLGPLAAWLLMRHVPLGLAVAGTTLGTLAGGALGLLFTMDPVLSMYAGLAGFGVSAIALRVRTRPRSRPPLGDARPDARLSA